MFAEGGESLVPMRKLLGLMLPLAAVALWSGCAGYSSSSLYRDDIKTIYVRFFDNRTFRRGLEVFLTKAVVDEVKLSTPLVFASRDQADSVLTGELMEFRLQTAVESQKVEVIVTRVTAVVKFRWYDRLTGADIVPEQTIEETVRIAPTLEENEHDLVFGEAAKRIVEHMREPW
jgi:hypothetical protein